MKKMKYKWDRRRRLIQTLKINFFISEHNDYQDNRRYAFWQCNQTSHTMEPDAKRPLIV